MCKINIQIPLMPHRKTNTHKHHIKDLRQYTSPIPTEVLFMFKDIELTQVKLCGGCYQGNNALCSERREEHTHTQVLRIYCLPGIFAVCLQYVCLWSGFVDSITGGSMSLSTF